jgi:predicted phosphodiesterase
MFSPATSSRCQDASGHSHIPWDSTAPTGLRLINPGSPTDRRRQPHATFLTASIAAGRLVDVELHRLGGAVGRPAQR